MVRMHLLRCNDAVLARPEYSGPSWNEPPLVLPDVGSEIIFNATVEERHERMIIQVKLSIPRFILQLSPCLHQQLLLQLTQQRLADNRNPSDLPKQARHRHYIQRASSSVATYDQTLCAGPRY
ncbi:hypothetical protein V6Z90_004046 [Aspergillus fumigatus]